MKRRIKKVIRFISNRVKRKVPIQCPCLYGELLKNRIALITGGSRGIGYSIAESFIKNGCSVILTGRNEKSLIEAVEELSKLAKSDTFIKHYCMDVSNVGNIEKSFKKIISENSKDRIDILVNNAGTQKSGEIGNTYENDWNRIINTNLRGTYFLCQLFSNYMIKNKIKGNILMVSSSSAIRPAVAPYAISKWGISGLTLGLAKKLIKYGIVVNGIAPGPTATQMLGDNIKEDITLTRLPAGRYILPEEVANISTILVSKLSRMIVGDTVYITGGAGNLTYDDIDY